MPRKQGNNEGTITRRKDGRWEARISLGRDATGKLKRVTLYGKTRQGSRQARQGFSTSDGSLP